MPILTFSLFFFLHLLLFIYYSIVKVANMFCYAIGQDKELWERAYLIF